MIWLGGIALTILGFLFGKVFSQSEVILSDKRRIYEEFLRICPQPSDGLGDDAEELLGGRIAKLNEHKGPLLIYASPDVIIALSEYLKSLSSLLDTKHTDARTIADIQRLATQAQNSLIIEMRRDVLSWSVFAYRGKKFQIPKI